MKSYIPISLKKIACQRLQQVKSGKVSRDEAERLLKEKVRHSSKTREDLIETLTRNYDQETVEVLKFFRLI